MHDAVVLIFDVHILEVERQSSEQKAFEPGNRQGRIGGAARTREREVLDRSETPGERNEITAGPSHHEVSASSGIGETEPAKEVDAGGCSNTGRGTRFTVHRLVVAEDRKRPVDHRAGFGGSRPEDDQETRHHTRYFSPHSHRFSSTRPAKVFADAR